MQTKEIEVHIPIFTCFNSPITTIHDAPDLHCLLINMIPNSILQPFKDAKMHKKLIKKLLLTFLFDLHRDIYELLWKKRMNKWKTHKKDNGINKKSFLKRPKQQRKRRRDDNDDTMSRNSNNYNDLNRGYSNPFMTPVRNLDNSTFWIYLTSSNFRHNIPWIKSLSLNFIDSIEFDRNLFYFNI